MYTFAKRAIEWIADRANTFAVILFLSFFVMLAATDLFCGFLNEGNPRIFIQNSMLAALTFLLPYLILPPAWRRTLWIPLIILPLLLITNTLYFQVFGDFYRLASITPANITDPMVVGSGLAKLSASMAAAFLLPVAVAAVFYFRWRSQILARRYSTQVRVIAAAMLLLIPTALFAMQVRRDKIYMQKMFSETDSWSGAITKTISRTRYPVWKSYLWRSGSGLFLSAHLLYELLPQLPERLSEADRRKVTALLDGSDRPAAPIAENRDKNLILIIVESFNSSLLDLPENMGVMPQVRRLMADSAAVVVPKVLSQVGVGMSADGQLMYNTGLYPLIKHPAGQRILDGDFPALAKALPRHFPAEAICEDKDFYEHSLTSRSYGYRKLYHSLAIDAGSAIADADSVLVERVTEIIPRLPQPFFLEITTLSMHSPYDESSCSPSLDSRNPAVAKLDPRAANYFDAANCFDRSLQRLIAFLKEKGLYSNSVIVIVGDHTALDTYLPENLQSQFVPLIILNSGKGLHYNSVVGQIDVFPTLLDVMGADSYILPATGRPYRGVGRSILSPMPPKGAVSRGGKPVPDSFSPDSIIHLRDICEKIILSRYFLN